MDELATIDTKGGQEIALAGRTSQLVAAAERAVIDSDETERKGTDLAKLFRTAISKVEAERQEIALPIDRGLKRFNARFKVLSSALTIGRLLIDKKVLAYKKAVQAKLDKAERERREQQALKEQADAKEQAQADGVAVEEAVVPAEPAPEPVKRAPVRTNIATSSVKKDWTYKVTDITELATNHPGLVMERGVEIRKLIAGGERALAGLEIYQKESLAVR